MCRFSSLINGNQPRFPTLVNHVNEFDGYVCIRSINFGRRYFLFDVVGFNIEGALLPGFNEGGNATLNTTALAQHLSGFHPWYDCMYIFVLKSLFVISLLLPLFFCVRCPLSFLQGSSLYTQTEESSTIPPTEKSIDCRSL